MYGNVGVEVWTIYCWLTALNTVLKVFVTELLKVQILNQRPESASSEFLVDTSLSIDPRISILMMDRA